MVKEYNILISSVGGQGGITLSRVIANAAMSQGLNLRLGETLGMAQRGGAVQSHVRLGEDVHGSLIPEGGADDLLALEPSEAVRVSKYLGPQTRVILNTAPTYPIPVMLKQVKYPSLDEITGALESIGCEVHAVDASRIARETEAPRSLNIAVLGAYMALGEAVLTEDAVKESLRNTLPARYLEQNLRAYEGGRQASTV
ncbi:indolepyruvate oxidoreductase subunit beta [Candidatus Bathyarchaeota archaeon]|nr:indolepyruvate oxidoreductase subunit beta [Candidatus Bathyarchaeota archaeon]